MKPWRVDKSDTRIQVIDGEGVMRIVSYQVQADELEVAERIVASVNACLGIDTKVLAANWPNGGLLPTAAIHEKAEGYDAILNELQNLVTALLARRGG